MNRNLIAGIGLSAFLFSACADDVSRPSGGGSIQPGEKISGLYVANQDTSITRIDLDTGVMKQIELGKEPTRIARFGGRVFVSLRNERAVIVLEENGTQLSQVGRIETGAEPFGLAATEGRLYVAASVGGTVDEYDSNTFEQLRSWRIAGEPRWLAMHPSNKSLYAASVYGGVFTRINLESGTAERIAVPRIDSFNFRDGSPITLAPRITGDIAVSSDGENVYLPMLYVDAMTTIPDVSDDEEADPCQGRGAEDSAPAPGNGFGMPPGGPNDCGGGGYDNQKFNPVATRVPVEPGSGEVVVGAAPEAIQLVSGVSTFDQFGVVSGFEQLNSYPSAIALSNDNKLVFATLEGSAALVAFPATLEGANAAVPTRGDAAAPTEPGVGGGGGFFGFRLIVPVRTGAAPRGIAVVGDKLFVHAFFDRQVQEISIDEIQQMVDYQTTGVLEKAFDVVNPDGSIRTLQAKNARLVNTATLDPQVDAGRRLFFAANNPLMATVGAGVSCGTCHFDGRTDGITWTFERGPRATPNLAVNLADTLPVGWAGNVPTVADEGFRTSQKLMGGNGLTLAHAGQLEKFLNSTREIDTPNKGKQSDAIIRGQALFANVGCGSCHSGASHTDGKVYNMLGLDVVNTPALKSVAATAPFFHDGSAPDLETVIDRAARGEMGAAFTISNAERADLVEYLKSL